uniref:Pleckstrin homology domain containing, family O member 2 n=1 Tax=Cynoglossus semilaevis TaxID=244447 RepID=A0A3P8V6Q3_CYNSE
LKEESSLGVKEDPTQGKKPKFLGKAGWVKKAPGKLLATYKERFVHVEKTEIVVYENEDLQKCLERLDLENYDRCHELKSTFKKKHRLILIRSPKSVSDMKTCTHTYSPLDHVTRTRPKGTRNRRPPTRIHLKEVADVSSDGILRLDLDLEGAVLLNGIPCVDGTETKKPVSVAPSSKATETESGLSAEESTVAEQDVTQQKLPPISEDEPEKNEESEDSVQSIIKPPVSQQEGSENLDAVLQAEDSEPSTKDPSGVCSSNNPLDAGLTTDLLLSHSPKEKQRKAEEKSVDSGQHSDDDSEGSGCEDLLAASSVALQGSQPGLDVLDPREDEVQILPLNQSKVPPKPHSEAKCFHNPKPAVGLKPYTKVKSASFSDLLSDTVKVTPPVRAGAQGGRNSAENVMKLKTEVAVEIQKTNELFDRVSKVQGCNEPQDLLSEAMEKLKKADHFLRQVHKIKMANNMYNRKSW